MNTTEPIPTMPLIPFPAALPPGKEFVANAIYSQQDLAEMFQVDERTIRRRHTARRDKYGRQIPRELPKPFRMGRKPYWRGQTLIEFFAKRQEEAA